MADPLIIALGIARL